MKKHQNKTVALPKSLRSHLLDAGMNPTRYGTLLRYLQGKGTVHSIKKEEMETLDVVSRLMVAEACRLQSLIQKKNKTHDSTP